MLVLYALADGAGVVAVKRLYARREAFLLLDYDHAGAGMIKVLSRRSVQRRGAPCITNKWLCFWLHGRARSCSV